VDGYLLCRRVAQTNTCRPCQEQCTATAQGVVGCESFATWEMPWDMCCRTCTVVVLPWWWWSYQVATFPALGKEPISAASATVCALVPWVLLQDRGWLM
jgi:hypothetical protein